MKNKQSNKLLKVAQLLTAISPEINIEYLKDVVTNDFINIDKLFNNSKNLLKSESFATLKLELNKIEKIIEESKRDIDLVQEYLLKK
jgi:hypothetical protein